jgi:putative DNA primase/helicase
MNGTPQEWEQITAGDPRLKSLDTVMGREPSTQSAEEAEPTSAIEPEPTTTSSPKGTPEEVAATIEDQEKVEAANVPDDVGIDGYLYTDHGNAKQFSFKFGRTVRYDHSRGKWFVWNLHWWIEDDSGQVYRLVELLAEARYHAAYQVDIAKREKAVKRALRSDSASGINNTMAVAQTLLPIADTGKNWDRDPWLFGVANGVIDLRTGKLVKGEPEQRITKHSPVKFDPDAKCPRWEQAMQEIFCGDQDLIDFFQRALGYCLTGDVSED